MNNNSEKPDSRKAEPINIDDLTDIRDVKIDPLLPLEERRKSYLEQVKNPYCYRCGDTIIRVSFNEESGATLADRLRQYLLSSSRIEMLEDGSSDKE